MTESAERLKSELANLSQQDRAALARFLIDSLDGETNDDVEDAWEIELNRRAAMILNGSAVGEPAEKVFKELREKYS